jgi:hypothetical protein
MIVRLRIVGLHLHRPAKQRQRLIILTALKRKHTQEVQRIGMIRLRRQHLPIERFGFSKLSRLVALKCQLKDLIEV